MLISVPILYVPEVKIYCSYSTSLITIKITLSQKLVGAEKYKAFVLRIVFFIIYNEIVSS
jgi:hypothetical protein